MTERGDDLRTTAEELVADADRLRRIEETKVRLAHDDPALITLAEEAVELTEEMAGKARLQRALAGDEKG